MCTINIPCLPSSSKSVLCFYHIPRTPLNESIHITKELLETVNILLLNSCFIEIYTEYYNLSSKKYEIFLTVYLCSSSAHTINALRDAKSLSKNRKICIFFNAYMSCVQ